MEMWKDIRRRILVEGEAERQICREHGIHFRTLQKILEHAEPPGYRQSKPREKRKIGPYLSRLILPVESEAGHNAITTLQLDLHWPAKLLF
jgi:hypothetical protein